ncbi:MAG TPA: hypothetical protein VGV61_16035 [Thermoanaerobaculia bacterium]|nr:hypothetical protein [Thermoanaerobaculia bacterium]
MAALLLVGASALQCRHEAATRTARERLWQSTGATARHSEAASRARRDLDPEASRVSLARLLVGESFDTSGLAKLPPAEAAAEARRIDERLALAAAEARAAWRRRPSSYEAPMALGGARLLLAWHSRNEALYRDLDVWRAPLQQAIRLAPGNPAPRRLLATAYLIAWEALSDRDRAAARALLREAFHDPDTLVQLLPAWAALAGSWSALEAVLPPGPRPYELLQQADLRAQDWAGYCAARHRWLPLVVREQQQRLAEAEERLAGGDEHGARETLLAVAAAAPPDRRTLELFDRAIEALPPGPVGGSRADALAGWLRWALPLWQLGQPTLPAPVLARVASLAAELPPEQAALAALAAGDLARGELWERREQRLWSEEWAPYAAAKAELLLARGHLDEAAATLEQVHHSYRQRWPYLRARERLAAARGESQPAPAPQATAWGAEAWRYHGNEATLELLAARAAPGLALAVDLAPPEGSVAELVWDGVTVGCFPLGTGTTLRLALRVTAGPHLLIWRPLAPARVAPGAVTLAGGDAGL